MDQLGCTDWTKLHTKKETQKVIVTDTCATKYNENKKLTDSEELKAVLL